SCALQHTLQTTQNNPSITHTCPLCRPSTAAGHRPHPCHFNIDVVLTQGCQTGGQRLQSSILDVFWRMSSVCNDTKISFTDVPSR
uniref:Uncharacterized protein n=2 Tax=Oreochromis TaxID=8139 RepID=A0A669BL47_ORENI